MAKRVLKLSFKNEKNKTKTITIADPKDGLSKEAVQDAMAKIVGTRTRSFNDRC